jgi:hypothetical protein
MKKIHPRLQSFKQVQRHMTSIFESLNPPLRQSDGTLTVDTAELRMKCADIGGMIDSLVSTPIMETNATTLAKQIIDLWVRAQEMQAICRDLQRPLQRLAGALSDSGRLKPAAKPEAER